VQGYLVLTGHLLQNQAVIISDKSFGSLKPDQQKVLLQAVRDAGDYQNQILATAEKQQLELVRGKGMKVVQPDVEAFRKATADVHKKYEGAWGKGFFERIRDTR
jgi:TRAP-type C4-dicarboxylate transport system substrate-binding protein